MSGERTRRCTNCGRTTNARGALVTQSGGWYCKRHRCLIAHAEAILNRKHAIPTES